MIDDPNRQTGRSTSKRLLALAQACGYPGHPIEFHDHMPNTIEQARRHRKIIQEYIEKLGLNCTTRLINNRVLVTAHPIGVKK